MNLCGAVEGSPGHVGAAQANDDKQNLGRGKEVGSSVDISAKPVPGLKFVKFLLFVPAILNELFPLAA